MKSKKITSGNESQINSQDIQSVRDDPSQRNQMIAIAAYFRAEKRGFSPNDEQGDWFEAEREINRRLSSFSS